MFVGRGREVGELLRALDDTAATVGSLFLVHGETGIGKTWIAEEVARCAVESGQFDVLWARCREGKGVPHYWPWIQIVRRAADNPALWNGTEAEDLLAQLSSRTAPARESLCRDDFQRGDATVEFLKRSAKARPLLLMLDDLQWVDPYSLEILDFLAGELSGTPIVAIGMFREVDVRLDPALRAGFGRLGRRARSIPLRGLNQTEIAEVLDRRFCLHLPPRTVEGLRDMTGGNPWFVDEIVRLALSEAEAARGQPAPSSVALPEGIRAAVRRHVEPLTTPARELLAVAAVMGEVLSLSALETVCGLSQEEVLELVAQPATRQIVQPDAIASGLLRFSPPVVAEAIYDDLDLLNRAGLERRVNGANASCLRTTSTARVTVELVQTLQGQEAVEQAPRRVPVGRDRAAEPEPSLSGGANDASSVFRREGEYWTIAYAGRTIRLRDAKGFRYLAILIGQQLAEVHASDFPLIVAGTTRGPDSEPLPGTSSPFLSVQRLGDAGQLLDIRAKTAYRKRIEELREALGEARETNNAGRAAIIQDEIDAIAHELAVSVGLGGRDRKAASTSERARVNVTRTIRAAIDRIAQGHPGLGEHLTVSIRTGTYCSYSPDPAIRLAWRL